MPISSEVARDVWSVQGTFWSANVGEEQGPSTDTVKCFICQWYHTTQECPVRETFQGLLATELMRCLKQENITKYVCKAQD